MGLADWFRDFAGAIQVRDGGTISNRYKLITRRLNIDFWNTASETSHSLYVGSYGRNTAVSGFSDLDMVMELPSALYHKYNNYIGNGQSALLQAVKVSIEKTYWNTSIKADGQVIVIPFTDGISFELLPAFANTDGAYNFGDANGGGSWRVTNPRAEMTAFRNRNAACNGNLVQLGRMARAWRDTWDVPIGGLLIDTLAYQFIENWGHRDKSYLYYDFMARDFFQWMAIKVRSKSIGKPRVAGSTFMERGFSSIRQSVATISRWKRLSMKQLPPRGSGPPSNVGAIFLALTFRVKK